MGRHAEKLRELVKSDLGEWAKELMEDPTVDAALRVRVMVPFSNAVRQLETAAGLLEREEPAEEAP